MTNIIEIPQTRLKKVTVNKGSQELVDAYISDDGLHLVTGSECSGKSTFVDVIAVDTAIARGIDPEDIHYLQISDEGRVGKHVHTFVNLTSVYDPGYVDELNNWIANIRNAWKNSEPKVIVLDEIRHSEVMKIAVDLARNYTVFAVLVSRNNEQLHRFSDAFDDAENQVDVTVPIAKVSMVETLGKDDLNSPLPISNTVESIAIYAEYKTETFRFPL